jgi:glycerol-3-phosphate acyltransferase PlsX
MAGGTIKIRPLPGVDRPAIGSIIPSNNCNFVLIDAGANPEPKPIHLVHNAIMGSIYAKIVLNIPNPRVGLLTIGTEEGKGTELVQQSHQMLKQLGNVINYTGPVEGFQLFANQVDVVVCDGFVGNILLKTAESLFEMIKTVLKEELNATPIRKIGALMSKGAFTGMKKRLNPVEFAGAPFLGLKGNVLKAHGSSDRHYIKGAIGMARRVVQFEMLSEIEKSIETANKVINE